VDELLSSDLAAELEKRVGDTSEFGFWQVRKEIARSKTVFSNNFQYTWDLLQHGDEEAVRDTRTRRRTRDSDTSTTFNDPKQKTRKWASPAKRRRLY
jgi:hypothetical protein